jgi:ethanolamine utilization microcompartment shell protein EutS
MSASAIELGFLDDYLGPRVLVFINGLSVRSSLFAQKMSASAIELGFLDDFLGPRVLVFVNSF